MAEPTDSLRQAEAKGHEPTDISTRGVLLVGAAIALTVILSAAFLVGLIGLFEGMLERGPVSPLERAEIVPPEPRLNPRPAQQLVEIRRREDGLLESYGWVDPDAGIARIPIERAMELLAEEGWPTEDESAWPEVPAGDVP